MKDNNYTPPKQFCCNFHCPHCQTFAQQSWAYLMASDHLKRTGMTALNIPSQVKSFSSNVDSKWQVAKCEFCGEVSYWLFGQMVYPKILVTSPPNNDLPEDIKTDYLEAAKILQDSPRASAALLRLALQKLCISLGGKGKDIFEDIGTFVKERNLNPSVHKAMDALRITGNNAVHPGQIDLTEDYPRVISLFKLINFIAEKMITEVKEIDDIYSGLPERAREAVDVRDGVANE